MDYQDKSCFSKLRLCAYSYVTFIHATLPNPSQFFQEGLYHSQSSRLFHVSRITSILSLYWHSIYCFSVRYTFWLSPYNKRLHPFCIPLYY
nr:MAG TPA: hypothetical protein [Caudoviricetes sp.]